MRTIRLLLTHVAHLIIAVPTEQISRVIHPKELEKENEHTLFHFTDRIPCQILSGTSSTPTALISSESHHKEAIIVDRIEGIIALSEEKIQPLPRIFKGLLAWEIFWGTTLYQKKITFLLDLHAILNHNTNARPISD
ncbi:chemotaxis protein CheW [Magnetococcales bacterium HHB-1]